MTRRSFTGLGLGVAAALSSGLSRAQTHAAAAAATPGRVVAESSFARIEEVGDGLFAVLSTPLDDQGRIIHRETLCNGGVIVGDERMLAVDAYFDPSGAAWVNAQLQRLFGRSVSDVICTHLHLDHTGGLAGFQDADSGPEIYMTARTWSLILEKYTGARPSKDSPFLLPSAKIVGPTRIIDDSSEAFTLDLGGRGVTVELLAGHTPSDLVVHVNDEALTYAGDLVWWGLFPNYIDAVPSQLGPSVARLMNGESRLMVSGHGALVRSDAMAPYAELIASVEDAASAARDRGMSAEEAGAAYRLPRATANWGYFDPRYPGRAIAAWFREWDQSSA
jgi:glyoxylase-like metal-dependent hydrolase (beta-lactamase superfamily II)